jgi:hypothetical protein
LFACFGRKFDRTIFEKMTSSHLALSLNSQFNTHFLVGVLTRKIATKNAFSYPLLQPKIVTKNKAYICSHQKAQCLPLNKNFRCPSRQKKWQKKQIIKIAKNKNKKLFLY